MHGSAERIGARGQSATTSSSDDVVTVRVPRDVAPALAYEMGFEISRGELEDHGRDACRGFIEELRAHVAQAEAAFAALEQLSWGQPPADAEMTMSRARLDVFARGVLDLFLDCPEVEEYQPLVPICILLGDALGMSIERFVGDQLARRLAQYGGRSDVLEERAAQALARLIAHGSHS